LEIRSAQADFKSGERFRVKITPTFTGFLQIQHKGTSSVTEVLFPRAPIQYVQLNAGQSMVIPADPKRFYYFDDKKGIEQIIVQFADYQGIQGQFSNKVIHRQDDGRSTYLMQEVSKTQHPFIIQAISMEHK
jgi:hypothetical protein